jgi:hypothetical protein
MATYGIEPRSIKWESGQVNILQPPLGGTTTMQRIRARHARRAAKLGLRSVRIEQAAPDGKLAALMAEYWEAWASNPRNPHAVLLETHGEGSHNFYSSER